MLDFVYLAQYTSHSDETLQYLDEALDIFHKEKQVFQEIWPEINFNLPKLHSLLHFSQLIRLFGATDNYNTEQFERLHIDFTKDAFRASNKRDEHPQMIKWIEKIEQVHLFQQILEWQKSVSQEEEAQVANKLFKTTFLIAKTPSVIQRNYTEIIRLYKTSDFERTLKIFLQKRGFQLGRQQEVSLPFNSVPIWTKVRLRLPDI